MTVLEDHFLKLHVILQPLQLPPHRAVRQQDLRRRPLLQDVQAGQRRLGPLLRGFLARRPTKYDINDKLI